MTVETVLHVCNAQLKLQIGEKFPEKYTGKTLQMTSG